MGQRPKIGLVENRIKGALPVEQLAVPGAVNLVKPAGPGVDPQFRGKEGFVDGAEMAVETIVDFLKRRGLPAIVLGLLLGGGLAFTAYSILPVTYTAIASITIRAPRDAHPERFIISEGFAEFVFNHRKASLRDSLRIVLSILSYVIGLPE